MQACSEHAKDDPDSARAGRLHRRLKARAAAAGMTLSDYLRLELDRVSSQLTADEMRQRLAHLEPVAVRPSPVDAVRAERDSR